MSEKKNFYVYFLVFSRCFFFSALMRDRDELAAALEVRDRIKYDLSTPEREEILSTGDLIVEVMFCKTDFEDNNGSFPNQSLFF